MIRPRADSDIDAYADYLAESGSIDVALRFLDQVYESFSLLASQPNIGWRSKGAYPAVDGLRLFRVPTFRRMLIFYLPTTEGIEILRVIHGSRNLEALLRRQGLK